MYSASLLPWLRDATPGHKAWVAYALIDQSYALSIQHYEQYPRLTIAQRLAAEDGHAVVRFLPESDGLVARLLQRGVGEFVVGQLQLLQAQCIDRVGGQPGQHLGQANREGVDVPGGKLHGGFA